MELLGDREDESRGEVGSLELVSAVGFEGIECQCYLPYVMNFVGC